MKFGAKEVTVIVDAVCTLALYFVGKYAGASLEDVKFVIVALQPVAAILIAAVTVENVVKIKSAQ